MCLLYPLVIMKYVYLQIIVLLYESIKYQLIYDVYLRVSFNRVIDIDRVLISHGTEISQR